MKIDIPENKIFKKNDKLEIGKINLLYGSNGVGKTMLSRAFALIDIETNLFTSEIKDDLKKNLKITSIQK